MNAILCAALATLCSAQEPRPGTPPTWSMKADLVESCCCDPICPCIVGSTPTHGHCLGNRLVEITEGHFGDVRLDGVSMVLVFNVGQWSKLFVSDKATEEQVRATRALLDEQSGFLFGEVLETARVPLEVLRTESTIEFSVPTAGARMEVMTGRDGKPIRVQNLNTFRGYVQYRSSEVHHEDLQEERAFSFSGTNGFSAHYVAASPAPVDDDTSIRLITERAIPLRSIDPTLPDRARHPNLVYILADDLGYGDLRCYRPDSKIPTPNLDRLAEEGARFTDAHSPSAVCTPTRYGILTGRYCWRTELQRSVLWSWDPPLIEAGRLTVPAFLRNHGYQTACIGKWHLGWDWPILEDGVAVHGGPRTNADLLIDFRQPIANGPLTRGFDHYFGDDVPNFPPYCFIQDDHTVGIPSVLKPSTMFGAPGPMLPGWKLEGVMPELASQAVRYIEDRAQSMAGEPFFLYLPLTAPHTPIAPDESFAGASEAGPYGDYVAQVDGLVGRVLETLARTGLEGNTLVIFTSDNGSPARNGHGMSGAAGSVTKDFGHDPNAPWRGMKADIFEGGHRVPFLVRWPGHVQPGSVEDEVICLTDLFATLAEILGVELPPDAAEDSVSILSVLEGEQRAGPIREATVHHSIDGMFAIRQGDWKLIEGRGSGGWTKPARIPHREGEPEGQLYNLASDPGETVDLYRDRPDVVLRLMEILERYRASGRSTPGEGGDD